MGTRGSKNHVDSKVRLGPPLEFMRLVWTLNHALERTSKRMESSLGLTAPQRMVLRIIGRYPGIAPARLAEILSVHPATLSVALKRLEARGLVEREPDPNDRRSVHLTLSPGGRWYDVPAESTVESAVEKALATLPKATVASARKTIEAVVAALEEQADPAAR